MKFVQHNDGSLDIKFSWRERFILFTKGKLHLSDEGLRHFGNNLMRMIIEWQMYFNDDIKKLNTHENSKVEGE